jgi:hypothetical protein
MIEGSEQRVSMMHGRNVDVIQENRWRSMQGYISLIVIVMNDPWRSVLASCNDGYENAQDVSVSESVGTVSFWYLSIPSKITGTVSLPVSPIINLTNLYSQSHRCFIQNSPTNFVTKVDVLQMFAYSFLDDPQPQSIDVFNTYRITNYFDRGMIGKLHHTAVIPRFLCRSQVRTKEMQIPPSVKTKRRQNPTVNDRRTNPYRLGRRPSEQGPPLLQSNQGRVEKMATGKHLNMKHATGNKHRLRLSKTLWQLEYGTYRNYELPVN